MRLWAVTFCIKIMTTIIFIWYYFTCFKNKDISEKRLSYKIVHLFFDYFFIYRNSRQSTWLSLKLIKTNKTLLSTVITFDFLFKFHIFSHVLSHPNPYYWVFVWHYFKREAMIFKMVFTSNPNIKEKKHQKSKSINQSKSKKRNSYMKCALNTTNLFNR